MEILSRKINCLVHLFFPDNFIYLFTLVLWNICILLYIFSESFLFSLLVDLPFVIFQLKSPDILPRHCILTHTNNSVTVTPLNRDGHVYVDNHRIFETTILHHGTVVVFGNRHVFRFNDPNLEHVSFTPHITKYVICYLNIQFLPPSPPPLPLYPTNRYSHTSNCSTL